ncbi:MAG: hypothetical protein QW279_06055 [Candidatus Jordarchaeaceae archaeon]
MENDVAFVPQNLKLNSLLPGLLESSTNFEEVERLLEEVCSKIATHYNLFYENGKPRKSIIIEAIANFPCLICLTERLFDRTATKNVDAFYKECHRLAVNILFEKLYHLLDQRGYKIAVLTEAELKYGKADLLIMVTNYGLNLQSKVKELLVEVKTGNSLSFTQIFRYLLDPKSDTIIVWRIRKRQVLVFNTEKFKPLLAEFMRMICLKAIRLLSSQQTQPCQHAHPLNYQPTQTELEKTFEDFSEAFVETLPAVLQIILKQLEKIIPQESAVNNG